MTGPLQVRRDLDPLIGREPQLAVVLDELDASRLVSITGPGGIGKTRLARAALSHLAAQSEECWFVDASLVRMADALGTAISQELELDGSPGGSPMESVVRSLAGRRATVGLDNLEQIDGVSVVIGRLLAQLPDLRILATSRVQLGMPGESQVALPPLDLPENARPEVVVASPAGALFLQRARGIGRHIDLDALVAADLSKLLARLDGLPLAIELAAARTRVMTAGEILRRLDERGVSAVDRADGDERRSLRAIIEWSLDLLGPEDAQVLRAASVCAGFDLDLLEAVAGTNDALDNVDSLVGLGLIQAAGDGDRGTRFKLLETVRHEQVSALKPDEQATYLQRLARAMHARAVWLTRHAPKGWTPDIVAKLDPDADNLRLALDWFDANDPVRGVDLWRSLMPFWESRSRSLEGIWRFERSAALVPAPGPEIAAALPRFISMVSDAHGVAAVRPFLAKAIETARAVGDRRSEVEMLQIELLALSDEPDSRPRMDEVVALLEAVALELDGADSQVGMVVAQARAFHAQAVHGLGSAEAVLALREAHEAAARGDMVMDTARTAGNLTLALIHQQDASAVYYADVAVQGFRSMQHHFLPWALGLQATAQALIGRVDDAIDSITEAIALVMATSEDLSWYLLWSIPVADAAGQPLLAGRLWGAITAFDRTGRWDASSDDRRLAERLVNSARRHAREIDFELAVREGAIADPTQLLAAIPDLVRSEGGHRSPSTHLRHGELTRREVEILTLVGQGRSNPEIAQELYISSKTVSVHLANAKAKLGLESRLELALRARELGLL